MIPIIGRTVIYRTTEIERKDMDSMDGEGRFANVQDELPATIVAVWGDTEDACVNLKVHIDGDKPDIWVTSVPPGEREGEWYWPEIKS